MPVHPSPGPLNTTHDASAWPPLLTIARAVAYSGLSRSTLNRAIGRGDLPLYGRVGGQGHTRIVRREDLDRWLAGDIRRADEMGTLRAASASRPPDVAPALERIRRAARGATR